MGEEGDTLGAPKEAEAGEKSRAAGTHEGSAPLAPSPRKSAAAAGGAGSASLPRQDPRAMGSVSKGAAAAPPVVQSREAMRGLANQLSSTARYGSRFTLQVV